MEEIKLGLYSVCRTNEHDDNGDVGDRYFDFGFPFVASDDRAACGMVKKCLEECKHQIDASKFCVYRVADFFPDRNVPIVPCVGLVERCDHLLESEVVTDE